MTGVSDQTPKIAVVFNLIASRRDELSLALLWRGSQPLRVQRMRHNDSAVEEVTLGRASCTMWQNGHVADEADVN